MKSVMRERESAVGGEGLSVVEGSDDSMNKNGRERREKMGRE